MSEPIVEFLLARIEEDHAAADLVLRPYGDFAATNNAAWWAKDEDWYQMGLSSDETPLVTRHTPQRVLAEVEFKRWLVELHSGSHHCDGGPDDTGWVHEFETCPTLRLLALPYADHPDFREEWRR